MFNEIDEDFDDVAIRTFKVGLPTEHDLRKSLTKKPVRSIRQLMDRIDEYKRVEEDQQQGRGNAKEPVHQVLEKIQNEPYFKWPNKMAGDPMRRNQNLHCHYHQERGHTTKNCSTLWNHLEQLVKEGRLKQFLYRPNGQRDHSGRTSSRPSRVMSVARTHAVESSSEPKRIKENVPPILGFSEEDKIETIQPHDDALVVTLRIGGYDVKKVMVNQGSGVDIMYPDSFKGLNLKLEELKA
ncbi:uncharacterized protein LOC142640280 [Castanea sativa]|uniref:uncharacterized protein LOC142640280 n=1 Tax=Castanea sativa TaxID=21020 RepID=UPI003F64EC11